MDRRPRIKTWSLVALLIAVFISPFAVASSPKNIDINIQSSDSVLTGVESSFELVITPQRGYDQLYLEVEGEGALYANTVTYLADDETRISVPFEASDSASTGRISVQVRAFNASGEVLFERRAYLYAVVASDVAYLSSAAELYARIAAHDASTSIMKAGAFAPFKANAIQSDSLPDRGKTYASDALLEEYLSADEPVVSYKASTVTVNGSASWTDSEGTVRAIPGAMIEVYEMDSGSPVLLTTGTTGFNGSFSMGVVHDDADEDGTDIMVRIVAESAYAEIVADTTGAEAYYMESSTFSDIETGGSVTVSLTADNTTAAGQAFSLHTAMIWGATYTRMINSGSVPAKITTRFPTTESTSLFDGSDLHILLEDRWDWDVILHEYGHYVMDAFDFEDNPGGAHAFNSNLSTTHGSKDVGIRLAWGEGWPTYFAIAGQIQLGLASQGIPNVGDLSYQDTEDASLSINLETATGVGEDDEVSVMAILWDLTDAADDGEKLSLNPRSLLSTLKANNVTTLGEVWTVLTDSLGYEDKAEYGAMFAAHAVAPQLLLPVDYASYDSTTEFSWNANGAGSDNPLNAFNIRFFDSAFSTETLSKDVGDVTTSSLTTAELDTASSEGSLIKWVVTGSGTNSPETPSVTSEYWSEARVLNGASIVFVIDDTGSMSQEIAGVIEALSDYITYLDTSLEGATAPTIHLLTFKDDVTHVLTTNDLAALKTEVEALTASGGNDCPEASAAGLRAASELVSSGGTIFVATDASTHLGEDLDAVVSDLRSRGVTVNAILSGDCTSSYYKPGELESVQGKPTADGSDDETSGSVSDSGSVYDGIDMTGDDLASASEISKNALILGMIEDYSDVDFFKMEMTAGTTYMINLQSLSGTYAYLSIYNDEETAQSFSWNGYPYSSLYTGTETGATAMFTPTETGMYYLKVHGNGSYVPTYQLLVTADSYSALVSSSVQLFSVLTEETGGTFAKISEINSGDDSEYVSTIFNIMRSYSEPTVVTTSIRSLPQGATATVQFNGLNVNWVSGVSSLSLVDADGETPTGVTVESVTVDSSTQISAVIGVSSEAELETLDVHVDTQLGEETEVAVGSSMIVISAATTTPTILSVSPSRINQGETLVLTVQAINTSFVDDMTVTLGSGITVDSVTVLSETEAEITVTASESAPIGLKNLTVAGAYTLSDALVVVTDTTVPSISAITPSQVSRSETTSIAITGVNTNFVDGTTVASMGDGITVNRVTIGSATEAVVNVTVDAEAVIGFRNVTLTTSGEAATLLSGLYVNDEEVVVDTGTGTSTEIDETPSGDGFGGAFNPLWGLALLAFGLFAQGRKRHV